MTEIRYFEQSKLPLVCGVCETAITESNPLELKMLHTEESRDGQKVFLPDLWIGKCCMPFDEIKYLERKYKK